MDLGILVENYNGCGKKHRQVLITETSAKACESTGLSFADVQVHRMPAAQIGALGVTVGSQVVLADELDRAPDGVFQFVLAHELAHVAQKRLSSSDSIPALSGALELEADNAAANILSGRCTSIRLADDPGRRAYWGHLGHYYTVYYIMLKAGVDPKTAEQRAFMCQLPDQVHQFDAMAATRDYNETAPAEQIRVSVYDPVAAVGGYFLGVKRANPHDKFTCDRVYKYHHDGFRLEQYEALTENAQTRKDRRHWDQAVIKGLHCLTGQGSKDETKFRLSCVRNNWADPLLSGLALHPFGDSFSHRTLGDGDVMYGSHHGHAGDAHKPDHIKQRPELYLLYCKTLYELIPNSLAASRPFDQFVRPELETMFAVKGTKHTPAFEGKYNHHPARTEKVELSGESAEHAAENVMMQLLGKTAGFNKRYVPEAKAAYWRVFSVASPNAEILRDMGGADEVYQQIKKAGMRWKSRIV